MDILPRLTGMSAPRNLGLPVLMGLCLSVAMSGCAGAGEVTGSVPASTTAAVATPTAEPTDSAPATATAAAAVAGCPPNGASIPTGADTATIDDVDGDGRPDVEYYSESPTFEYGIQTASGATITLADDLAGPNRHGGWSAVLENETVITVLDDGRSATLHAFVDCGFVTTRGVDGAPYRFLLNGFGDAGTGVECSSGNGGRQLLGVLATRQSDDLYDISHTVVTVPRGGLLATNGSPAPAATDLPASDAQVVAAMRSSCGDVPKVQTSGM